MQQTLTAETSLRLNWHQRLLLRTTGHVYLGHRAMPGWRGRLPFYAFTCPEHGVVVDYPHGFDGRLVCPHCNESEKIVPSVPEADVEALTVGIEASG